ncbi:MAG: helix-turn-helix transcriptional regulator [Clostridia bacterium]|nr:helix-turn-helix transcriptional regulator [Clostridia bacterium]
MRTKYHFDNNFTTDPKTLGDLVLYQLGEMLCDSTTVVEPHVHLDWFELTYVFQGSGTIYTNDVSLQVNEGDVYVSFPREIHKIVSDNINPLRYCFFAFNFTDKERFAEVVESWEKFRHPKSRVLHSPHYEKYFSNALHYINTMTAPLMTKLLEYELLTLIIRVAHRAQSSNQEYHPPKVNNFQLLTFNIANYIDINLTTMDDTSCLAEVFNYNYSYLSRCFKKCMQTSISQYFNDKKLNMARNLLEGESLPITEIATKLNYSTIYVFSRAFKNKYGVSPTEYRNAHLEKKKQQE